MGKYILGVFMFLSYSFLLAQEKELQFSMQEAIEYALKNNFDNKIASKNIEASEAIKWETITIGLPQISGKVDYQNWLKQQVSLLDTGAFTTGENTGVYSELIFLQKQQIFRLSGLKCVRLDWKKAPTGVSIPRKERFSFFFL